MQQNASSLRHKPALVAFLLQLISQQPGHEYTLTNCKFLTTVLQTDSVKKLNAFAENNKETQGKFSIGDEKVGRVPECALGLEENSS